MAVAIGSVRNSPHNTLIVGSIDGQIALYHLENLVDCFDDFVFKGKPTELGVGRTEEEMKVFDAELEAGFDPNIQQREEQPPFSPRPEEGRRRVPQGETAIRLRNTDIVHEEGVRIGPGREGLAPSLQQRIQANISLIKCKFVYLSTSGTSRKDCIFVATNDCFLYCYTLECNISEAKTHALVWRPTIESVELKEKSSAKQDSFHLVGLKVWKFSSPIRALSMVKIWNKYKLLSAERDDSAPPIHPSLAQRRRDSFGESNACYNDVLLCVGLQDHKVALFPYSSSRLNQTSNELVLRPLYDLPMLNIQINVHVCADDSIIVLVRIRALRADGQKSRAQHVPPTRPSCRERKGRLRGLPMLAERSDAVRNSEPGTGAGKAAGVQSAVAHRSRGDGQGAHPR